MTVPTETWNHGHGTVTWAKWARFSTIFNQLNTGVTEIYTPVEGVTEKLILPELNNERSLMLSADGVRDSSLHTYRLSIQSDLPYIGTPLPSTIFDKWVSQLENVSYVCHNFKTVTHVRHILHAFPQIAKFLSSRNVTYVCHTLVRVKIKCDTFNLKCTLH